MTQFSISCRTWKWLLKRATLSEEDLLCILFLCVFIRIDVWDILSYTQVNTLLYRQQKLYLLYNRSLLKCLWIHSIRRSKCRTSCSLSSFNTVNNLPTKEKKRQTATFRFEIPKSAKRKLCNNTGTWENSFLIGRLKLRSIWPMSEQLGNK